MVIKDFEEADFVYLKEKTEATSGNIRVQLDKLAAAEYIEVKKSFVGRKPRTTCRITNKGKEAFEEYINALRSYLHL